MTFDFNVPAKTLHGIKEEGRTRNDVMIEFIGSENGKSGITKLCYWYETLLSKKPLELDEPDKKLLIDLIDKSDRIVVFVKAQLLEVLNS